MLEFYRLRSHRIHRFKPKVTILADKGAFVLKTVTSHRELTEALRLRYEVFHHEMRGIKKPTGIDVDHFDLICDHLIIVEKKTERVVGTYRLNCSKFSHEFYAAQEFHIRRLLEVPGPKLELGRACIHRDFRNGRVAALLWSGIAKYMAATGAETLFGCASLKTDSARQAGLLYNRFHRERRISGELICPPTKKHSMENLGLWIEKTNRPLTLEEKIETDELLPPLFRAYLQAGALLAGEPAFDSEFQCIDFLTILPRENLNKVLWRKQDLWSPHEDLSNQEESFWRPSPKPEISLAL